MQKDKIDTLLGFAVKAGKLIYGADNLDTIRKRIFLIIMCASTADNTREKVIQSALKRKVPLVIALKPLQDILYKQNCKIAALQDEQMANAIMNNLNDNFQLYVAEVK